MHYCFIVSISTHFRTHPHLTTSSKGTTKLKFKSHINVIYSFLWLLLCILQAGFREMKKHENSFGTRIYFSIYCNVEEGGGKKHQRTFQKNCKCTRVTVLFIHKVPIWQTSTDWTYLFYVCLHRLRHKLTTLRLIFRQSLEVMSGSSIKIKFSSVYHSLENSFTIYVKLVCILVWNLCWELRSTSDNQEHLFLFSLRELFQ